MLRMTIHSAVAGLVGLIGVARVPLVAQTNLAATATAPTKVALSWTGASGANGYSILRGVGTGTLTSINPAKVTGTTYTDLTAPAGTALRYRIRASYPSGPHTYSDKVSVTTPTAASVASAPAASPAPPSGGAAPAAAAAPPSAPAATGRQLLAQGTPLPVLQAAPLAVASTARMAPVTAPSGPAPQNVRVQSSGPVAHTVVWDRLPGVSGYLVAYSGPTAAGQFLTLTPQPVLAETYQHATIVSPGATFRVTALYADGRQGNTDFVYTNPPPAQAPSGFTAQKTGPGQVALSWQSVPFAKTYRVFGTGMPQDGLVVSTTGTTFSNLADGSYSWQVTADYGGAYLAAGLPTQSITLATAASARYRVVANGFSVIHESYDDMLSRDGKYDEVYGGFTMLHFDQVGCRHFLVARSC